MNRERPTWCPDTGCEFRGSIGSLLCAGRAQGARLCLSFKQSIGVCTLDRITDEEIIELQRLLAQLYSGATEIHHPLTSASSSKENNAALATRIREFEYCIRVIATELGSVCCGGVDRDQSDPHSTTAVLVEAIRKLRNTPNGGITG